MTFRLRDGLSIGDQSVITYDGELIGNDFYYENTLPSVTPTLNLNFLTQKLDPRITFTRESTATYTDQFGNIATAAVNTPRFDHNPITGECKGLLIEEARTNYCEYSNMFSSWTVGANTTLNANYAIAPDGTNTAWYVTDNSASSYGYLQSTASRAYTVNDVYCGSLYVLKDNIPQSSRYCILRVTFIGSTRSIDVGLDTKTGEVAGKTNGSETTLTEFGCVDCGNYWRIWVSGYSTYGNYVQIQVYSSVGSGALSNLSYSSTTIGSITIWGAQLEKGAFPTSYIPTTTVAATRSADNARITGTNFSSWYNKDEGTLFTESQYFGPNSVDATTTGIVTLSGGQSNNFISVIARTDNNSSRIYYAPYKSLIYGSGSYPINKFAKIAGVYKNLDLAFSKDGSLLTDNITSIPTITPFDRLVIGAYYVEGSRRLNGHIKSIKYYPKRLTNAELQAITL